MMNDTYDQQTHWDELHTRYLGPEHNAEAAGLFARRVGGWLAVQGMQGRLLELGCGGGADLGYFSGQGWDAVGLDFSRAGLCAAGGRLGGAARLVKGHLAQGLPFEAGVFSVVYAHLSLHYFSDEITKFLFADIHRVLGLNGVLALRVKSVENVSCGKGKLVDTDTYLYHGHVRRFFRQELLDALVTQRSWTSMDGWQNEEQPGYISALLQKNTRRTTL